MVPEDGSVNLNKAVINDDFPAPVLPNETYEILLRLKTYLESLDDNYQQFQFSHALLI